MFYDEFIKLCNGIQKSPTAVAKEIGLAGAHVTKWKNGSTPTDATVYKVCDYFKIPYNYFNDPKSRAFYDKFKLLCDKKGVSVSRACIEIGLNRSAVAKWKGGSTPNGATLQKLADYFGVTTDYLLSGEKKDTPISLSKRDERDIEKRLEAMIGDLEGPTDGLMFSGEPLDAETRELLRASLRSQLEMTKKLAKQKYTPKKYRKRGE